MATYCQEEGEEEEEHLMGRAQRAAKRRAAQSSPKARAYAEKKVMEILNAERSLAGNWEMKGNFATGSTTHQRIRHEYWSGVGRSA